MQIGLMRSYVNLAAHRRMLHHRIDAGGLAHARHRTQSALALGTGGPVSQRSTATLEPSRNRITATMPVASARDSIPTLLRTVHTPVISIVRSFAVVIAWS